jgi:hypothetical protein
MNALDPQDGRLSILKVVGILCILVITLVSTSVVVDHLANYKRRSSAKDYLHGVKLAIKGEVGLARFAPFIKVGAAEYVLAPMADWKVKTRIQFTNSIGPDGRPITVTPHGRLQVWIGEHSAVSNLSCQLKLPEAGVVSDLALPAFALDKPKDPP